MAKFRVYQVQELIEIHKSLYEIVADDIDDAIEKAMNGYAKPVEQGTIGEPEYAVWGWSARPAKRRNDDAAWDKAISTMEANRREHW